jgi:hypothetical protein
MESSNKGDLILFLLFIVIMCAFLFFTACTKKIEPVINSAPDIMLGDPTKGKRSTEKFTTGTYAPDTF